MRIKIIPPTALAVLVIVALLIGSTPSLAAGCDGPQPIADIDLDNGLTAWEIYPQLPLAIQAHQVWIDGVLAPVGTRITATGQNVRTYAVYPDAVLVLSSVGGVPEWNPVGQTLLVQGIPAPGDYSGQIAIPADSPITFYVNGVPAKVRIYEDSGLAYTDPAILIDPSVEWLDSLPFASGGTYLIDLMVGDIEPVVTPTPSITSPCTTWDRNNVRWTDKDRYWIDTWKEDPEKAFLAETFGHLAADWFVPVYRQEQTVEAYQRMVFFANHGGYGCTPDLKSMVEAQGWANMGLYGWPYSTGGGIDPDYRWMRIGAMESGENHLPSLFCPPLTHPVLVENGYVYSGPPTPTPEPTTVTPTSTPPPPPTTARSVSSGGGGGGSGTYIVSSQPLVEPTATPTPTVTPSVIGTPVITPVPTATWSETYITPVTYTRVLRLPSPNNVAIYYSNLPLPACDLEELYVPAGYGVLRVSAGSSEGQFYLNDALITNGGVTILKGIPAGEYTITFRERYYETEQFVVPIRPDCVTNVEVTPEGPGLLGIIGWPPDWLLDNAPSLSENVDFWYENLLEPKPSTGSFQIMTWWDGTDVFLDGQFFAAGCDIPCDFTFHGIEPGIHHITYVTDQYESTFPVIIGAGTLTKIGGGAAVQGRESSGQYTPVNPWDLYEGPE